MVIKTGFQVPSNHDALEKAIEAAGSQAELARRLEQSSGVKCYPQKINEWRIRGIIPPYWVKHVAEVAGIDPSEIDPLLYD